MTAPRCSATTSAKKPCKKAPYTTAQSLTANGLEEQLPNAATRCYLHLTAEEKQTIRQIEVDRERALRDAFNVDPACWSWVVTDEIRTDLAASEAADSLAENVNLFCRGMRAFDHGCCAICGQLGNEVQDHDHETGLVRGWLCRSCNTREGMYPCGGNDVFARYRRWHPYKMLGLQHRYWDRFTHDWAPENPPPSTEAMWKNHPLRGVL